MLGGPIVGVDFHLGGCSLLGRRSCWGTCWPFPSTVTITILGSIGGFGWPLMMMFIQQL